MNIEWTTRTIDAPAGNLFDATEVAKILGVSRDTFDSLVKSGEFPSPQKIGRSTLVWGWRDLVYYLLRMEMGQRIDPKSSGIGGKPSETGG